MLGFNRTFFGDDIPGAVGLLCDIDNTISQFDISTEYLGSFGIGMCGT